MKHIRCIFFVLILVQGIAQTPHLIIPKGHAKEITSVCFSPDGKYIVTGTEDNTAKLWEIFENSYHSFQGHMGKITSVAFSPDSKKILTGSEDKTAKLWNLHEKELVTYRLPEKVVSVAFSPDGNSILTACNKSIIKLWDLSGKELITFNEQQNKNIAMAVFAPDGNSIAVSGSEGIVTIFDLRGNIIKSINIHSPVNSLTFSADGKDVITGSASGYIQMWNVGSGKNINNLGFLSNEIFSVATSGNGKFVAAGTHDGNIELWNLSNNNSKLLVGHTSILHALHFSADGKYLLSGSEDETTKLWDCESGRELLTMISLDSKDWVVTNPEGFFDANTEGMEHLDYEIGSEEVELEQLKERYYEPGLLEEVFGLTEMDFGNVNTLTTVALYPEMEAIIQGKELNINLKPRSGGIGKLSVFVDHKEVIEDANPDRKTNLKIDLSHFDKFYFGDTNVISLIVYNEEGWLESRSMDLLYFPYRGSKGSEGNAKTIAPTVFKGKPHLYALVVGTSKYSSDNLNLKFPDLDAAAIAQGLQAVGSRLFDDRVHIKLLSTSGKTPDEISSKINIEKALKEFAEKATPGDIVISYFSGHGTTYGQAEKNQFYYLTKDIANENLSDPEIRKNYTVSSDDLTKWLTAIPAHKEVLIFDACHSGKAVESLAMLGARDLSPSQIRALDRMKDRSGIFILSGSAADAVSYEASTYGQGLLTYSLLAGMSGLAVTEDKRVDLANLFEYARDKVPEFAKSINKIQVPVVAFPKGGGSFDIGIVDASVKIPLAQPKPVFIRNVFMDEKTITDDLELTHALSEYFRSISAQGAAADLIYVDVNDYENAYSIKGLYTVSGNIINLRARLFLGKTSVGEFKSSGDKTKIAELINTIVEKVSSFINKK